jgi:hypothetical protein
VVAAAVEAEVEAAVEGIIPTGSVSAISGLKRARARLLDTTITAPTAAGESIASTAIPTGEPEPSSSSSSDVDAPEAKRQRTNRSTVFG